MDRPLYVYTYADVPYDDAVTLLSEDPEGLLQKATDVSSAHGGDLVGNLHVDVGGFELGRDVVIELGEFTAEDDLRGTLPVKWRAAKGHLLFPTMNATLEVSALSLHPPLVQVTLAGTYAPPLGSVGALLDQMFDRRLAEAVVHRFVGEVASRLEDLVATAKEPDSSTT
jgi:hypothetical protein